MVGLPAHPAVSVCRVRWGATRATQTPALGLQDGWHRHVPDSEDRLKWPCPHVVAASRPLALGEVLTLGLASE